MRVLLLGGRGFLGRNLREQLPDAYTVEAPTREELDVFDGDAVERFLNGQFYDVVLNALDLNLNKASEFNACGTASARLRQFFNLVRCRHRFGKMIFYGSGAEYDRALPICSIEETAFDRRVPRDEYGFCLYAMTRHAMEMGQMVNLRLFGIFGKYELWQQRFLSNAICKALCGFPITIRQNCYFDYLFVDDLVGMTDWVMRNDTKSCHYNAVSGQRYSLVDLADTVREVTGANVPILVAKEGLGAEYTASCERLSAEMGGFHPTPIREAIRQLTLYYKGCISQIDRETLLYPGK